MSLMKNQMSFVPSKLSVLAASSLLLTSLISNFAAAQVQNHPSQVLIKNVHVLGGEVSRDALHDVLIEGDKILAIGKKLKLKNKGQQIDGKGGYLTPGLIDAHVHLDGVPGYTAYDPKDEAMLQQAREQIPRSYSYFGFTTILDLTGESGFIANWNKNPMAPRALYCTPLSIPNGYPAIMMGKETQFKHPIAQAMLWDPAQAKTYPSDFKQEQHTPEYVVNLAQKVGSSCVKVFYETGFGPQKNLPVPTVEMIQAVVKEAHQRHMPVYLHGNSQAAYEFALKTGVDVLVHGLWHEEKGVDPQLNQARLQEMAVELKQAGIAVQPTIQVLSGELEETNPHFFDHPYVQHGMPASLVKWYQSEAGQFFKRMLAEQVVEPGASAEDTYLMMKKMYAKPLRSVQNMTANLHKAGATLQFGSDTPSGPFYTQFPGMNGRWEMDRWLEAGMSLEELFAALTQANAKALGLGDKIGRVAVGMQADLLLLKDNPLKTVQAYDQIDTVVLRGKPMARAQLSATRSK
ncbi:amidohydrolase family protein [Undibacterium cyanobacteriorum]|uniref:Amidohydrolase family protein n=1 Tax=Undibacterium cyanobacteriorum TaxID=3073561 RepID=A0ABY9RKP0_9BURK|nr:amidohydrolase family protein [Undibacterium sp. 20NA77.5]WMW80830.1 amidohydrolase family protein [Undibacterium sp. 20NA77.5]